MCLELETLSCGEQQVLYRNFISEISMKSPTDLGNEPDACYCLLHQVSTAPWPAGSSVRGRFIDLSNVSIGWIVLDESDSTHGEDPTIGIKFQYSYTGGGGGFPILSVVVDDGDLIRRTAFLPGLTQVLIIVDISLVLSCDPTDYYDPRLDATTANALTIPTTTTLHPTHDSTTAITTVTAFLPLATSTDDAAITASTALASTVASSLDSSPSSSSSVSSIAPRSEPSSDANVTLFAVIAVLAAALMTFTVIAVVIYLRRHKQRQWKQSQQRDANQYITPARDLPVSSDQSNSTYTSLSPTAQTADYIEIIDVSTMAAVPAAEICDHETVDVNAGRSDLACENQNRLYENMPAPCSDSYQS